MVNNDAGSGERPKDARALRVLSQYRRTDEGIAWGCYATVRCCKAPAAEHCCSTDLRECDMRAAEGVRCCRASAAEGLLGGFGAAQDGGARCSGLVGWLGGCCCVCCRVESAWVDALGGVVLGWCSVGVRARVLLE